MNIDDFKASWDADQASVRTLPKHVVPARQVGSIVQQVRKNIRKEFLLQVLFYIMVIMAVFLLYKDVLIQVLVCLTSFLLCLQTAYYYLRFYVFYKAIGDYDMNTRQSISLIVYEMKLNLELYRAYISCAAPMVILVLSLLFFGNQVSIYFHQLSSPGIFIHKGIYQKDSSLLPLILLLSFTGLQVAIYFLMRWNIRARYGRYLDEMNEVMSCLENEV